MINILCIIIVCLIAVLVKAYHRQSKNTPPGPYPWPVIGNLRLLRKLCAKFGGQHNAFLQLRKEYNSNVINLHMGNSNVIVVNGYDTIQKVLRGEVYDARPWNEFTKMRNMGLRKGITMAEGPEWREMRAWLIRSLRYLGLGRAEMSNKIEDELVIILDKLKKQNTDSVRMLPIIASAVINVIWSLATGKRLENETRVQYFLALMERRAKAFDLAGGLLSIFPWIRHIAPESSGYKLLTTMNHELKEFVMGTIDEHKQNYVKGKEVDLIDMFLTEMYDGKGPAAGFTEDQLLMILVDLFIAGLQTTALTLDFLFLYMTVHQDVQCKLHAELDSVIKNDGLPQLTDRDMLPYTEAVMTESQRLRLVVPIIGPRRALNDTTLNGYDIPKDSVILMNIYSVHTDPENFEDPQSFKPERHLQDDKFVLDKKLIFFGGGHRRCPGEIVARSETFLLFTGIMRHFQLLPVNNDIPDTDPLPGLTISPKPYRIKLVERMK
nr:cytochrome P450 4AV17 [Meteorus pulchricornis]